MGVDSTGGDARTACSQKRGVQYGKRENARDRETVSNVVVPVPERPGLACPRAADEEDALGVLRVDHLVLLGGKSLKIFDNGEKAALLC